MASTIRLNGRDVVSALREVRCPLAVRYALKRGEDVAGVVLCTSFVANPLPRWLSVVPPWLVRPLLFRIPLPRFMIKAAPVGACPNR